MHRRQTALALLAAAPLLAVPPGTARAQAPDSAAFHRGQWGMNLTLAYGAAGAGAIRFTSATRAVVLDLSASTSRTSYESSGSVNRTTDVGSDAKLGLRRYHVIGPRLYRWGTVGVTVSYDYRSTRYTYGGVVTTEGYSGLGGGVFGNLGATWLVTPHLGLGAQWEATFVYLHSESTTSRADSWKLALATVAAVGQLYF
jgi:hypothetical protein